MIKVYLVESEHVSDCQVVRKEKRAFPESEKDKAREFFNEEKRAYERIAIDNEWEHDKSEDCVEYFEEGYYAHNHASVTITEIEVKETPDTDSISRVKHCPLCGSENIEYMADAFEKGNDTPFHCHECDNFFDVNV